VVPALRAACFKRRACMRWLLDNRLGLVLLILAAIMDLSAGQIRSLRKCLLSCLQQGFDFFDRLGY